MSVEENLMMGAYTFRKDKARMRQKIEENYQRFPILKEKRRQLAGELSGGQQRMVELGRTLMTDPKVILVDEPTAGLAKLLSEEVYQMLTNLRDDDGKTILLVDQEIRQALNDLTRRALGPYAMPFVSEAPDTGYNEEPIGPDYAAPVSQEYFNNRKITIYGGSNEIQRGIITKMMMGL